MSDSRAIKPTPISSDTVGSILGEFAEEKKKERLEEKSRLKAGRKHQLLLPVLALLISGMFAAPLMAPEPVELSHETLEQGAKMTLYLASLRVRQYQRTHRTLPVSLKDAGVENAGLEYTRNSPVVFELATRLNGARLVYRSTQPDSVFLGPKLRIRGIS